MESLINKPLQFSKQCWCSWSYKSETKRCHDRHHTVNDCIIGIATKELVSMCTVLLCISHCLAGPLQPCSEAVVERCHDVPHSLPSRELNDQSVACEQESFRVRHYCTMIEWQQWGELGSWTTTTASLWSSAGRSCSHRKTHCCAKYITKSVNQNAHSIRSGCQWEIVSIVYISTGLD